MAQNPYIRDVNNEQNLLEDLNAEFIRALGRNCYYIPRTLNEYDPIYGEDTRSSFDRAYLIEMYMENPQSFGGDGDIVSLGLILEIKPPLELQLELLKEK